MATTKFDKPVGTEIDPINSNLENKSNYTGDLLLCPAGTYRYVNSANKPSSETSGYVTCISRASNYKSLFCITDAGQAFVNAMKSGTWSGWKQLDPETTTYTVAKEDCSYTYNGVTFYKSGGTVLVHVHGFNGLPNGAVTTICTIPAKCKPSINQNNDIVAMDGTSYRMLRFYLTAAGNFQCYNYGSNAFTNNNYGPGLTFFL